MIAWMMRQKKKDLSYLQEYQDVTGTAAAQGKPKYYAMFGGATGNTDTTSGRIFLAPTPNTNYLARIHFNKIDLDAPLSCDFIKFFLKSDEFLIP